MASHAEPIEAMRGAGRAVDGRRRLGTAVAQKALVIVQVAVSLVLLSAAAMLGQSLRNLERQTSDSIPTVGTWSRSIRKLSNYQPGATGPAVPSIEARLRAIPACAHGGAVLEAPLGGWVWPHDIRIEGKPEPDVAPSGWTRVTPGFFAALRGQRS